MAKKNGGYLDMYPLPIVSEQLAQEMLAEAVNVVEVYDEETKTRSPKVNDAGLTQYEIQTLFIPAEGDERHTVAIVPVKVWSRTLPTVKVNAPVEFVDLRVTPWAMGKNSGLSYSASGFTQD